MSNVLEILQDVVMTTQSATVIGGESPSTFGDLWSRTDAFAGGLQARGITAGDTVGIRLSNSRAFLVAVYGTLRNGCIPVTIPSTYGRNDVVTALNETDSSAYVTDETPFMSILHRAEDAHLAITVECEARMGVDLPTFLDNDGINSAGSRTGIDVVRQSDSDPSLIAYVEPESGDPLGITYTHGAFANAARHGRSILDHEDPITHLGSQPLSNPIELLYGATATILDGGQYRPQVEWDPETVRSLLYTDDSCRTFLTPQQYDEIRDHDAAIDDAIGVVEPTDAPLEEDANGDAVRLRGVPETGLTHVRTPADVAANRLGDPLPGVQTSIREDHTDGELAVSSPATMQGYVDRPELTEDRVRTIDGTDWVYTALTGLEENALESA